MVLENHDVNVGSSLQAESDCEEKYRDLLNIDLFQNWGRGRGVGELN